ncbi:MAG: arsenic resistance protein, partial [Cycloclasticus sp.]
MTELPEKNLSIFERYLSVWVVLCIGGGIFLGKIAPGVATTLNDFSIYQVSIPIAVCLFFMMYPIMLKIDFAQVLKSAKTPKPVMLTLFINWGIKPFSMFAISYLFLGHLFKDLL